MARTKAASKHKRRSMIYISCFLTIMIAVMLVLSLGLDSQRKSLLAESEELANRKRVEMQRSEDIEQFKQNTNTKEFIEETAKEKLGLIYENEIIFKKDK